MTLEVGAIVSLIGLVVTLLSALVGVVWRASKAFAELSVTIKHLTRGLSRLEDVFDKHSEGLVNISTRLSVVEAIMKRVIEEEPYDS